MKFLNRFALAFLVTLLIACMAAPAAFANAAEPPSILILVPNAPEGMELALNLGDRFDPENLRIPYGKELDADSGDIIVPAEPQVQWMETSFRFYVYHLDPRETYEIIMTVDGQTSLIPITNIERTYNNVYTLNWKDKTLTPDRSPVRSALFVFLRVSLTLMIEGIVFFLMGFRTKRSWLVFLSLNLVTQGALNIWLNSMFPSNGYVIFALIFGEFFVLIAEMVGFLTLITEKKRWQTVFYVLLANIASLVLGGYLITLMPL